MKPGLHGAKAALKPAAPG